MMYSHLTEPPICIAGLSYHNAGVDRFADLKRANSSLWESDLEQLKSALDSNEVALINTCNRLEIIASGSALEKTTQAAESFFQTSPCYVKQGSQAVRHFYRVLTSLDSLILGESQIVAQLKKSYQQAVSSATSGPYLHRLFQTGFHCSKQVRSQTALTQGNISIVSVGLQLLQQVLGSLIDKRILLLGAGDTAELCLQHLKGLGCNNFVIANRSFEKSQQLAERYAAAAVSLDVAPSYFEKCDLIISALSNTSYCYSLADFSNLNLAENLCILDLGMPSNFDPAIAQMEDLYLFSMYDLQVLAEKNRHNRQLAAIDAELIIDRQVLNYQRWYGRYSNRAQIASLHEQALAIAENLITKENLAPALESYQSKITGAIFHELLKNKGIIT